MTPEIFMRMGTFMHQPIGQQRGREELLRRTFAPLTVKFANNGCFYGYGECPRWALISALRREYSRIVVTHFSTLCTTSRTAELTRYSGASSMG